MLMINPSRCARICGSTARYAPAQAGGRRMRGCARVPALTADRPPAPDIAALARMIEEGGFEGLIEDSAK